MPRQSSPRTCHRSGDRSAAIGQSQWLVVTPNYPLWATDAYGRIKVFLVSTRRTTCPWRILDSAEIRRWAEFLSRHSDHSGSCANAEECTGVAGLILRFSPSAVISAWHSGQTSRTVFRHCWSFSQTVFDGSEL